LILLWRLDRQEGVHGSQEWEQAISVRQDTGIIQVTQVHGGAVEIRFIAIRTTLRRIRHLPHMKEDPVAKIKYKTGFSPLIRHTYSQKHYAEAYAWWQALLKCLPPNFSSKSTASTKYPKTHITFLYYTSKQLYPNFITKKITHSFTIQNFKKWVSLKT